MKKSIKDTLDNQVFDKSPTDSVLNRTHRLSKPKIPSVYFNSLNLIILLGFMCQAASWENYYIYPLFFLFWFFCIKFSQAKQFISEFVEIVIFIFALIFSIKFLGDNYFTRCIAVGNALVVLQGMWLMWPLDIRKQLFSTFMALTLIAAGSQMILGFDFILVVLFTLILLPKTFFDIHYRDKYKILKKRISEDKYKIEIDCIHQEKSHDISDNIVIKKNKFSMTKLDYLTLLICMLLFFIVLPRDRFIFDFSAFGQFSKINAENHELNTSKGGEKNLPDTVLFQIYGKDISYLRSYTLSKFNGLKWRAGSDNYWKRGRLSNIGESDNSLYRKVDIRTKFREKYLPVDGSVLGIKGNFFEYAYSTSQGNLMVSLNKFKKNKSYEYWISSKREPIEKLTEKELQQYTYYPDVSEKLESWLDNLLKDKGNDPFLQSKFIESYLNNNFRYQLDTPELDPVNPFEDLIFNQKSGHCERFASTMGLLLRMRGVPSRVVIGYLTREKNSFTDLYTVRANYSHAWTEGYFEDRGWVLFDATPYGTYYYEGKDKDNYEMFTSIYDWFEYMWYSKVVMFSSGEQKYFLKSAVKFIEWCFKHILTMLPFIIIVVIILLMIIYLKSVLNLLIKIFYYRQYKKDKQKYAVHFYGQMLSLLARKKIIRKQSQTPFEFLLDLEKQHCSNIDKIKLITEQFCKVKYGNQDLSSESRNEIKNALYIIKTVSY